MTQEEKAKAYDEALEKAKKIHNEHKAQPFDVMLKVFPELAESEDERIRKALIRFHKSTIDLDGIKGEDIIAWLEKQGKHAKFRDSIQVGDKVVGIAGGEITIFALRQDYELVERPKSIEDAVEEELNKGLQTKVEQNPAWSEEDETNFRRTEYAVMKFFGGDCSLVGWLRKSIKERYTWKPSDEYI